MVEASFQVMFDIGIIIIAASAIALLANALKQPLLGAYILAGILIGPEVLGVIQPEGIIQSFANLGIAFLLFIVGLELDLSRLREVRNVVLGAAVAQILLTFGLGFYIMYFLGFESLSAIYVGLFVAFSSTAVVVKTLSDTGDIDTLHGRIILGILLIQDIVVVLALSILSTLQPPVFSPDAILSSLSTGLGLLALAIVMSNYIVPTVFEQIKESHELIFLTSLAVLFGFVGASVNAGLSEAVGGFLAGIALTAFPYNVEIAERARPMRDFFVTIFFVSLGTMVSISSVSTLLVPLILLTAVVLLVKPFLLNLMVSLFRYGKKTSFYTGSSLAQISEFSMVIALLGATAPQSHIGQDMLSLATILMIITVPTTSYVMKYQKALYEHVEEYIIAFRGSQYEEEQSELADHVVLCGSHTTGRKILRFFEEQGEDMVVIDYDPDIINAVEEKGFQPIYGDIEDSQTLERANVSEAKAVISTVPNEEDNRYLVNYIRQENDEAVVIVSANDIESALLLYEEGADYVLYPKMLAAREAADLVRQFYTDGEPLERARTEHIQELEMEFEEHLLKQFEPDFVKKLKDRMRFIDTDDKETDRGRRRSRVVQEERDDQ